MAQLMDAMFDPPNILVWHKVSSAILIFYFYFKVDIFGLFGFIPILIKTKSYYLFMESGNLDTLKPSFIYLNLIWF